MYYNKEKLRKFKDFTIKVKFMDDVLKLCEMVTLSTIGIVQVNLKGKPVNMNNNESRMFAQARRVKAQVRYRKDHNNVERRGAEQYHFTFMDRRI